MKLITGKLNHEWLEGVMIAATEAVWVKAAVAYASGEPKLFDFCRQNNIRLNYWGRYDCSIPVATKILKNFLLEKSPNFTCKLIPDIFHAKVIWWGGYGAYIGSANLTAKAWIDNIECGIFMSESELVTKGIDLELEKFFNDIDEYAVPLTKEVYDELVEFESKQDDLNRQLRDLLAKLSQKRRTPYRKSLVSVDKVSRDDKAKGIFLKEWNDTLQILRDLSDLLIVQDNRPQWIEGDVAKGILADQFLHAYYYTRVRDGNSHPFNKFYDDHKDDPEAAVMEAITWWKNLKNPPSGEDTIIYEWAPLNFDYLSKSKLPSLNQSQFSEICSRVHAMREHSLRVDNETYGLPKDTKNKGRDECIELLSRYLWNQKTKSGKSVLEVIYYVLYGGAIEDVPNRLWEATQHDKWRIPHLGISALGEIVGWAMPDTYPPRNGRTSKALTALGHNVTIHSA